MASRDEGSSGLLVFLLGAAVGAVLGVLFAPKAGKETREDLTDWLKKRREEGSDLMARLKDEVPAQKDHLSAALKAGKQAYREAANGKHKDPLEA